MDKIISFGKGIRRQPSIGEDGELSELVNLVPKNGELANVREMVEADAPDLKAAILLGIHKVFNGDNYIVAQAWDGETLVLRYRTKKGGTWEDNSLGSIISSASPKIAFVGNTVIVLGTSKTYYYLWKNEEYVSLGSEIPELNLSFGLKTTAEWKTNTYEDNEYIITITNDKKVFGNGSEPEKPIEDKLKDMFIGGILELKNEIVSNKRFMWPFFVRYAYRMFDGTLVKHSSPILMTCATGVNPAIVFGGSKGAESSGNMYKGFGYHIVAASHALDYAVAGQVDIENWKDVIQSVDIFISPQIPTIDFDGDIPKGFIKGDKYKKEHRNSYSYGKFLNDDIIERYCKTDNLDIIGYSNKGDIAQDTNDAFFLRLPFNGAKLRTEVENASLFYKIASINISELQTDRTDVPIADGVLESLEGREVMTDDFFSHDYITAKGVFSYNSRLNLSGITKTLYDGAPFYTLFPYVNGEFDTTEGTNEEIQYYVYIRDGGRDIVVGGAVNKSDYYNYAHNGIHYFYYPNAKAYKVVIFRQGRYFSFPLKAHSLLNGAYAYNDMSELSIGNSEKAERDNEPTLYANDIYVSRANNPFIFDASGVVRIGDGEIIGISTAAKALSQGQFGQFPLYAFCTDGIWALEVASDGSYSAKQPISRDVCNNPDSITQIDGAVVFTTDQGLKMIQGSDVVLLSGNMDGHNVDEKKYFKDSGNKKFFASKGDKFVDYDKLLVQEMRDFREILRECRIAYDYPNNLLRIYPKENKGKYYVFDLGTREFSSVADDGSVHAVIPDYPTSLVQKDTKVYTFTNTSDNVNLRDGLLITRPISFGEPYSLKKLHDLRLHYTKMHADTKCYVVMFVSNDNIHWAELTSLRKGSFKYYRFALVTHLTDDDRLSGMVVRYEVERNNKMR